MESHPELKIWNTIVKHKHYPGNCNTRHSAQERQTKTTSTGPHKQFLRALLQSFLGYFFKKLVFKLRRLPVTQCIMSTKEKHWDSYIGTGRSFQEKQNTSATLRSRMEHCLPYYTGSIQHTQFPRFLIQEAAILTPAHEPTRQQHSLRQYDHNSTTPKTLLRTVTAASGADAISWFL